MNRIHILDRFKSSEVIIKDEEKLINYIDFCIDSSVPEHIKNKTASHHILPKSNDCFPEFTCLKEHSWNRAILLHKHHYTAHYKLLEAIESKSQVFAFVAMQNKDTKNNKLVSNDLVDAEIYGCIVEEARVAFTELMNTKVLDADGSVVTKGQIIGRKAAAIKRKLIELEDGTVTTIDKENGKRRSSQRRKEGRHFNIYHITKGIILNNVDEVDVRKFSQALPKTDKNNFLGKTIASRARLNKYNKLHLNGYYVEEVINNV